MIELATIEEEWHDGTAVARITGEIDTSNVTIVGARVRELLGNKALGLIIDLSGTAYLDSSGINLLFVLGDELRTRQQALRLVVGPTTPIARLLAIIGLDRTHPTFPTLPEALADI
jgi:anti-anti-sigma factor